LTAYHRPISICFVGKKLFLIFNKMFTISPWDFAVETANMTKQNILQQAASTILSQANQRPQSALSLLQG
ncbi:flagellin, partial [Aeromonas media]